MCAFVGALGVDAGRKGFLFLIDAGLLRKERRETNIGLSRCVSDIECTARYQACVFLFLPARNNHRDLKPREAQFKSRP